MTQDGGSRTIVLRNTRDEWGQRHLIAYVDAEGVPHIDGHDMGLGTTMVSGDGEYEWWSVYSVDDIPAIVALLDGNANDNVLDLLESRWTGERNGELERRLSDSGFLKGRKVWS